MKMPKIVPGRGRRAPVGAGPAMAMEDMGPAMRKGGGKVAGGKSKSRPDKRARGGATSDPFSGAGKMSEQSFVKKQAAGGSQGQGSDNGGYPR